MLKPLHDVEFALDRAVGDSARYLLHSFRESGRIVEASILLVRE